jgi:hypothetical protein
MNLKLIFTIYGGYSILMGAAFVFIPALVIQGAGLEPNSGLIATQQAWGTYILGLGFIAFSLRNADSDENLIGPAKGIMITALLITLITLYHLIQGFSGPPIFVNILVQGLTCIGIFLKTK